MVILNSVELLSWKQLDAYQESYDHFIKSYLLITFFFPPIFTLLMTAQFFLALLEKKNDVYGVNQQGLFCHSYLSAVSVSWRRFDCYRFRDDENFAGIRTFEFTVKPIKYIGDKKEH